MFVGKKLATLAEQSDSHEMKKSVLMQKQVKDNADDLQKEFLDMKNWEEQMKRKEEALKQETSNEASIPAVRSKPKRKAKKDGKGKCKNTSSCDYRAWDKYEAEEACKETEIKKESSGSECKTQSAQDCRTATEYKNKGNELVRQKQWSKAVKYYTVAMVLDPGNATYYANRAICFIKLDDYLAAEIDCTSATLLDRTYVKAYYRRAVARFNMCKFKEAKRDAKRVLLLDPWNREAKKMLEEVNDASVRENKLISELERLVRFETMWEHGMEMDVFYDDADAECNEENEDIDNEQSNSDATSSPKEERGNAENTKPIKDPRISPWLKECCDMGLIQFTDKPPHLRSKKPLTKIEVQETDLHRQSLNPDANTQRCSVIKKAPKKATCTSNDLAQQSSCATTSTPSEDNSVLPLPLPPPPKSAVEFILTWNKHKSSEFRYKYLKQLPPNGLSDIFLYSMEPDILSQILEVVGVEFVKRKDGVYNILKDISELKRFRALNLFFGASDTKCLEELFSYCKTAEKKSADEISSLRAKYEL